MASFGLKVIRGLFGLGERFSPAIAGRTAFELFCRTPNVKRLTAGERRAVSGAAQFMTEARHHRLKVGNRCVAVHEFRPDPGHPVRGTVLIVHGWRSRTEYMRALIEGFRQAGHKVVSLDLPGHGQSGGRRLTLVDAVRAVGAASDWFGPFAAIVGHSFGGAVAVNAVAGGLEGIAPVAAGRLVLIAAPCDMADVFAGFSRTVNLGPRSQDIMSARVERISGRRLEHFQGNRQLALTPVPTLVVHAHDDREVAAWHAERYAAAGDHVRLLWADGLGHRRILADAEVVRQSVGFVEEGAPGLRH
ncbi:alpha/beta hydrolase [Mesorhizobium sp. SP-1A]|uniref:alpha/beta hydrolase n=1 Tax=Mesorhizobium sp. SP-1A TaxID=3077840 RepID=UPI0028F73CEA|nr:alpha/beta fold hydrolase [Mesorhizobium sp. SP-1A]